jgi:hypothetical protein
MIGSSDITDVKDLVFVNAPLRDMPVAIDH